MTSSDKSDYVQGERTKGAIDNNRMTSSEKSDYVEGERIKGLTKGAMYRQQQNYEQREGRLYAEGERDS